MENLSLEKTDFIGPYSYNNFFVVIKIDASEQ